MNLYIDPGTGSMLFTILIGALSAGIYLLRSAFSRLRFFTTGGAKAGKRKKSRYLLRYLPTASAIGTCLNLYVMSLRSVGSIYPILPLRRTILHCKKIRICHL